MLLTADELMAGKDLIYDIDIPRTLLYPNPEGRTAPEEGRHQVRLRPLTVKDVQLIAKAAKDDEVLTSVLMIGRALVEPVLKQTEIAQLNSGLVRFLVERINQISGLSATEDDMRAMAQAPLVQAFFVLAREFNWTPAQVRELTVGQILGYLELMQQARGGTG
jgi:hypothetical protein